MAMTVDPHDIADVLPAEPPRRPTPACAYCGHTDFERGIELGQTAEAARIGLKFKASSFLGGALSLMGNEPLFADLCLTCGTVARLYVKETRRQWR